jgi:glycosyltransferase involved in cell wall biosynthesis
MEYMRELVSIGLPTYNRAESLKRSIESLLSQSYHHIEIIISDNGSTDCTKDLCLKFSAMDGRIKYIRHDINKGAAFNFNYVLESSTGDYFMWLGDDDWIDDTYINKCISTLVNDNELSLVCGSSTYYQAGRYAFKGQAINLLSDNGWQRMLSYYSSVTDNGTFYGVMRKKELKKIRMKNCMGTDWNIIAEISFVGKIKTLCTTSVHRELGGATKSYEDIASALGLTGYQKSFPHIAIAISSSQEVLLKNNSFSNKSYVSRLIAAIILFNLIVFKKAIRPFISRNLRKIINKF